jgi:hypothetical protein
MSFNTTKIAMALALTMGATAAHAVAVNTGDVLTIDAGIPTYNANGTLTGISGSWFAMDTNGSGTIQQSEKTALSQGTTGIKIGDITTAALGSYHFGAVTGSEPVNAIVASWNFNSSTGTNYNTVAITGSTESGLDFSGWNVAWNTLASIPMTGGAWGAGYTNGTANFTWSGVYGTAYTLDYHATVPAGDPSNFGGTLYALRFTGVVNQAAPVPEASTYGMMLAGLGLVGFAVRRRKLVA